MTATAERAPRYVRIEDRVYRLQQYVGVDGVAELMGVTPQYLNAHKWLLPNWGQSEVPGVRRWRLSTINTWLDEMTPTERQAAWDSLPPSTKAARARKWGVR